MQISSPAYKKHTQLINLILRTRGKSSSTWSNDAKRIASFEAATYLDARDGYEHDSGNNLKLLLHNLEV